MLTPDEQRRTWEGLYLAEMRANYYADLAGRCRQLQRLVTWASLLLSSGAVLGVVITHAPTWVAPVLSLISAGLTLFGHLMQYEKSCAQCAEMADRQNRLAMDYERLWGSMYDDDAPA